MIRPRASIRGIPRPILWLALGAFAIGTEGFMIAPLLPTIASDLSVSVSTAGQLVTAFALAYAFSSPILTALTGNLNRRRLLIGCLAAFALANVVACASSGYWQLMSARLLLAFAAGLYVPNANAVAAALVPPERRGQALSVVNGGTSLAIALGVPLGAMLGSSAGWRSTFAGVAVLATIATAGLAIGLPRDFATGIVVATLRQRISVVKNRAVLMGLLVTTLWATGAYTVYTYVATYLSEAASITGTHLSAVLFLWGLSAAVGVFLGGNMTDRFGPRRVIAPALVGLALAFCALSAVAKWIPPAFAVIPVVVTVIAWGVAAWAFFPAQQARLIGIAGLQLAPVALSLNASFMFVGFACGASLGAFVLNHGTSANLGWVAALSEVAALLMLGWMRSGEARALKVASALSPSR